jgi:two-component system response regulator FixJ
VDSKNPVHPGGAGGVGKGSSRGRGTLPILCVLERSGSVVERLLRAMHAPVQRCASGQAAVEIARAQPLACVIATLHMQDMNAQTLVAALRRAAPGLAIVILVDKPAAAEAGAIMRAGAHAVIDSRVLGTGLLQMLLPRASGNQELLETAQRELNQDMESLATGAARAQSRKRLATLTRRELEVVRLVTSGKANKVIALQLGLSQRTVEIHRAHAMDKMQAASLAELVRMVIEAGQATQIP